MRSVPILKTLITLGVFLALSLSSTLVLAETATEMMTKLDDELIAGNITEEATYTDLKATLNNAQTAGSQEDKDSAKDAYNTLVMVNGGGAINSEAVQRLIWP
jgi:hypothetical protein